MAGNAKRASSAAGLRATSGSRGELPIPISEARPSRLTFFAASARATTVLAKKTTVIIIKEDRVNPRPTRRRGETHLVLG